MTTLFVSLYFEKDERRRQELMDCLALNLNNMKIDRIVLLEEAGHGIEIDESNVEYVKMDDRPTFNDVFAVVNRMTGVGDLNIIANSDIFFDEYSITNMSRLKPDECYALTRWDMNEYGMADFMNRRDSQDTWCFRGKIKDVDANFQMGKPGCDNSLAACLHVAGYKVSNPSLHIKTFHLHAGDDRAWHGQPSVPPPYLLLEPTGIV